MPTSESAPVPRQWDVVVLPFPYADRLAEKRRPAVVISKPETADRHGIIWVAMITSAANSGWECDIPIPQNNDTGLLAPSVIRPWKIATVDVSRVVRVAGHLGAENAAELSQALMAVVSS